MKASDLFIECLEAEGVEYIFGVPGEENLDVLNSLKDSSIEVILTRNEQSAVFMAATYGRFTGKPGIAISTLGPGATNLVTGVGYAQLNGLPVIVLTGQKPIKKSKQGDFQVIDVVKMMEPITKMAVQIKNSARITSTIRQAFKTAIAERPGAVHLELPEDIASETINGYAPIVQMPIRRPVVEGVAINLLVTELENSQRPVVLVGAGANRKRVSRYLTEFVTKYNIPFFNSQMGKGVLSEDLAQYVGTAALSDGDSVHKVIESADLILAIGHDTIEKPTHFVTEGQTRTVHINYYEAKIDDVYAPHLELVGDIGNTFWQLCQKDIKHSWDHSRMFAIAEKEFQKSIENLAKEKDSETLMPRRFVKELRLALAEEDILALDNGWYKIWLARNYKTYHPNTIMLDNTFATMGAGMPSGMIAKFLNPSRKVVTVTGDGGLVMNLGDIETAVRMKVDLVIIILNNNAYGMIKIKQAQAGFDEYSLDFPNPVFIQLAESFGAKGIKVEKADEFYPALKKALHTRGVVLMDVAFTYPGSVVD